MTPIITEDKIRIFMMDKPELNPLLQGVRWDSKDIDEACINVVDFYNSALPILREQYTVENFPFRYLMLIGVAAHLLKSAAINQANNQFTVAADGVQVNEYDKAQLFGTMGASLWDEFKQAVQGIKITNNVAGAFGGMYSEYIYRYL